LTNIIHCIVFVIQGIYIKNMRTIPLTMRIEPEIKEQAQNLAHTLGFNLSSIIDAYLRQFIRTKEIYVSLVHETPSQKLVNSIEISEKELRTQKIKTFTHEKDALRFLQSSHLKKKR